MNPLVIDTDCELTGRAVATSQRRMILATS